MENAFETLSRDIHQMQVTGAIHSDWLARPKGFLLKPDFKRKQQLLGAGGKKLLTNVPGIHFTMPGKAAYKPRFFVLDQMVLRYYKNENEEQEAGNIHLESVNAVLPSRVPDAPEHALDLVCADRIYTIAGYNREDMVRWATVLTCVLKGEEVVKHKLRKMESTTSGTTKMDNGRFTRSSTSRSSLMSMDPRRSRMSMEPIRSGIDFKMNEKIVSVLFQKDEKLHLILQGTANKEVMVLGFEEPVDGGIGAAEKSGVIWRGDILVAINEFYFTTIKFKNAIEKVKNATRPLTLKFLRVDAAKQAEATRMAEGWVLAKEPATSKYRIRMLQLCKQELRLFKPAFPFGRQEKPCHIINLSGITDIRPINDLRENSKTSKQGHAKQYGLSLQGIPTIFTFYVKSKNDQLQWIDVLVNNPMVDDKRATNGIAVHPEVQIGANSVTSDKLVLSGLYEKLGEFDGKFSSRYLELFEGGRLFYKQSNTSKCLIRLEHLVSIALKFDREMDITLWARMIEKEATKLSGRMFNLAVVEICMEMPKEEFFKHSLLCNKTKNSDTSNSNGEWVYLKRPCDVGIKAYHLRYAVLLKFELKLFKYRQDRNDNANCLIIDLRGIKDVRLADYNNMDAYDFTIELVKIDNKIEVLTARSEEQKERLIKKLTWASDFYFGNVQSEKLCKVAENNPYWSEVKQSDLLTAQVRCKGKYFYACISNLVLSYFLNEADHADPWVDPLYAVPLSSISSIVATTNSEFGIHIVFTDCESQDLVLEMMTADQQLLWMAEICTGSRLVLDCEKGGNDDSQVWRSYKPQEEWIWKLNPLNFVYRKRYCSIQNDQVSFCTSPGGRVLNALRIDEIAKILLTRVATGEEGIADFRLQIMSTDIETTAIDAKDQERSALQITLAFSSEDLMLKWAKQLHHRCLIVTREDRLQPPRSEQIQFLPGNLVKEASFEKNPTSDDSSINQDNLDTESKIGTIYADPITMDIDLCMCGWLHYQKLRYLSDDAATELSSDRNSFGTPIHRIRLRFAVLYSFELGIYKNEVLPDEPVALQYEAIDCRKLVQIRRKFKGSPENCIELTFSNEATKVLLIPQSDVDEQKWWRAFLDVQQLYCTKHSLSDSQGAVFLYSTTEELELRNAAIRKNCLKRGNIQEWTGSIWQTKHFVITECRILMLSSASDLFDDDADMLDSMLISNIHTIRSVEATELPHDTDVPFAHCFKIEAEHTKTLLLQCDSEELSVQWMQALCNSTGKLELKKQATSNHWHSVNMIAEMSNHAGFHSSMNDVHDSKGRKKSLRLAAAQRVTCELINKQRQQP